MVTPVFLTLVCFLCVDITVILPPGAQAGAVGVENAVTGREGSVEERSAEAEGHIAAVGRREEVFAIGHRLKSRDGVGHTGGDHAVAECQLRFADGWQLKGGEYCDAGRVALDRDYLLLYVDFLVEPLAEERGAECEAE